MFKCLLISAFKKIGFFLIVLLAGFSGNAQISIASPSGTCVIAGTQYSYNISGTYAVSGSTFTWSIPSGSGTFVGSSTSPGVSIIWNVSTVPVTISLTYKNSSNVTQNASYTVNISSPLTMGPISPASQSIIASSAPANLVSTAPTGGNCSPNYAYQWQSGVYVNSVLTFSDISVASNASANQPTLVLPANMAPNSYYYQLKVTETGSNTTAFSTNIAQVTINPPLTANTINPATQDILTGLAPASLNGSPAYGGNCSGTTGYAYQWQSSSDNSSWNAIAGATSIGYNPPALSSNPSTAITNFYYRRQASLLCNGSVSGSPVYSISIVVIVHPHLATGAIITGNEIANYNTQPATLNAIASTGGLCTGGYIYLWQTSNDGNNWTNATGTNNTLFYVPPILPLGVYYYRMQTVCGSETVYTSAVTVTMMPQILPGAISGAATTVLSYNTSPGLFSSSQDATGGSCSPNYNYQWQLSVDGSNFTDIAGATLKTYTPVPIITPTYYRRKVSCGTSGTETVYSNILSYTVNPNLIPPGIFPQSLTIAAGTSPGLITANPAQGGACSGAFQYQWQSSPDNTNWTNINGATTLSFNPGNLSTSMYYRLQVTCSADIAFSNTAAIAIGVATIPGNYIRTRTFAKSGVLDMVTATGISNPNEVSQATQYYDGLGKPVQTVAMQLTPLQKDMVSINVYDNFGREISKYLPYASGTAGGNYKPNPLTELNSFNASLFPTDQYFYSQVQVEASPLSRVQMSLAAGNSWVGNNRGVTSQALVNTATEGVKIWNISYPAGSIPSSSAVYADGLLMKTVSTDEANHQVIEYKDKEGHVILKKVQLATTPGIDHTGWLCTYYVYDDFGQLRFVLQPKAVNLYLAGTALSSIADELCFRYEYDLKNRMIIKKIPGAGESWMVYDNRDRLVFTQDANMRLNNQWLSSFYDDQNRPVMTAMMSYTGTQSQLQTWVNQNTGNQTASTLNNSYNPAPELYVDQRQTNIGLYTAVNSVSLTSGFESESTAEFILQSGTAAASAENIAVLDNPVPTGSAIIPLTINYYDNYNWTNKTFDPSFNGKLDAGTNYMATSGSSIDPVTNTSDIAKINIHGMPTGSKVRVIENPNNFSAGIFLASVPFYDIRGRVVQTQTENYKGGVDIATQQYAFNGRVFSNYLSHNNPAAGMKPGVQTKMLYDHAGRVLTVNKSIYTNASDATAITTKKVSNSVYNELGQLKTKMLSPDFNNGAGIESLNFDYNIRGWLLGMNRNFLNDQGNNYFGYELGYNNSATYIAGTAYTNPQYNGNIGGMLWKSKGDAEKRKYDFTYDALNRLTAADFNQYTSSSFNKTAGLDFSVGNLSYDENGNILSMNQMGWKLSGSDFIDKMQYTYLPNTNKLKNVIDLNNDPLTILGDFRTSALHPQSGAKSTVGTDPNTITDYAYDVNGNLNKDFNKDIGTATSNGIIYNHLNLPYQITVQSATGVKGTITYIYDAAGNKLEKRVVDNTNITSPNSNTDYIGSFVYQKDTLQFLGQEEGRIRYKPINGTTPASYVFDYMIKDHLGNIRSLLTEEQETNAYIAATMEPANANQEKLYYSKIDETRTAISAIPGYPSNDTYTNPNANVAKLDGATNKIGPGITLKVMAGDMFSIRVSSWYKANGATPVAPTTSAIPDIIAALIPGVAGASKFSATQLQNTGVLSPGVTQFFQGQANDGTRPKAYLNWVLLDEHFKFVAGSSGSDQVPAESQYLNNTANPQVYVHTKPNLTVGKNGYLYIYVSNETANINVFFDNLQVTHVRGPLLEENHYYPFGLTMAGISTKALKTNYAENKYRFNKGSELQNKEFSDGSGLELYDTHYRQLDPQLGRWNQIDPKPDYSQSLYSAMNNNPITLNDPMGDTTWLYNQNGTSLGMVPDKLKNQVHYMKTDGDPGAEISTKGLSKKELNALGKSFRQNSFAFMGSKTVSDMKKISRLSTTKEVGFTGTIGKDKEIRLTALPIEQGSGSNHTSLEAQIDKSYPSAEMQSGIFLAGHTHNTDGATTSSANPQHTFGFPSPNDASGGDYGNFLYRNNDATQKGASPLLVVTVYGVTVYGSKEDYSNNAYLLYKSLKQ